MWREAAAHCVCQLAIKGSRRLDLVFVAWREH